MQKRLTSVPEISARQFRDCFLSVGPSSANNMVLARSLEFDSSNVIAACAIEFLRWRIKQPRVSVLGFFGGDESRVIDQPSHPSLWISAKGLSKMDSVTRSCGNTMIPRSESVNWVTGWTLAFSSLLFVFSMN